MTNKEKYYDELMDYALAGLDIAIDKNTNKIASCVGCQCSQCKFNTSGMACSEEKLKWLNEEYIEPEPKTDWSKVKVDTLILVKNKKDEPWRVRYFARYENENEGVYCWFNGATSYTVIDNEMSLWFFVKLPTPEELEQYRKKV